MTIGYGSSEFHVIRCSKNILNRYIFFYLVQEKFRSEAESKMTGAVGLRRVPKQFIENYLIPYTSIEEQKQIIQKIESRLSVCDKLEETIGSALKQSESLRQSILKKAFEGKLLADQELESVPSPHKIQDKLHF
ncbi:MAG: restriction endonuclease subunit S [Cyclobacteriaceae bacterium]